MPDRLVTPSTGLATLDDVQTLLYRYLFERVLQLVPVVVRRFLQEYSSDRANDVHALLDAVEYDPNLAIVPQILPELETGAGAAEQHGSAATLRTLRSPGAASDVRPGTTRPRRRAPVRPRRNLAEPRSR